MKKRFEFNQNNPASEYRIYTPAEVAAILNVSLRTVQEWIRKDLIPHMSLGDGGRLTRISAQDLEEFIRQNYQHKQAGDKPGSPLEDQSPQT